MLDPPPPSVSLRVLHESEEDPLTGDGKESSHKVEGERDRASFNRAFGLHYTLDQDTLLPSFTLEVNATDLFGPHCQAQTPSTFDRAVDLLLERQEWSSLRRRLC